MNNENASTSFVVSSLLNRRPKSLMLLIIAFIFFFYFYFFFFLKNILSILVFFDFTLDVTKSRKFRVKLNASIGIVAIKKNNNNNNKVFSRTAFKSGLLIQKGNSKKVGVMKKKKMMEYIGV